MGQYIGARYVPKFMGLYDATQAYENLCIVDNGLGTSYISRKPTPAGTPLTDTTYWAVYGASSGAIINLQNQIGDLTNLTTSDRSNLVNAINEVDSDIQTLTNNINRTVIKNETVTLEDGNFEYIDCTINPITAETIVTGTHVFKNCTVGQLFIRGGVYIFEDCTYDSMRIVNGTGQLKHCSGGSVYLNGQCHNSIIDGCTIVANVVAWGAVTINGNIAENVKVTNNNITNHMPTATGIETECINVHGLYNGVISNNVCDRIVGDITSADTDIDITGTGDPLIAPITTMNVVVENNITNGDITLVSPANVKVCNNVARRMWLFGNFDSSLDYGTWLIENNDLQKIRLTTNSGTAPLLTIIFNGNVFNREKAIEGAGISGATMRFFNNTFVGQMVQSDTILASAVLPIETVYIKAGGTEYIPKSYIVYSEISDLTAGSVYQGGAVDNATAALRYVKYSQIGTQSAFTDYWCQ